MNQRISLFIIFALLVPGHLSAAAEELAPLSLKEAEQIAIRNHPRITAAELNALASAQVVRETRSAFYPIITADATAAGVSGDNTRIAAGGLNNPLILDRNAEGINISQIITDFGRTANLTSSSKLHSRAAAEDALATRAQILLQLDAAFFDTLQAQSVLEVAKQTVATRQLIFDQVSEQASNQLRSGLDVSFARVDLEQSQLLLAGSSNDLAAAFAGLANLLGGREPLNYRLLEEPVPTNAPQAQDTVQLAQDALENRPDLAQLRFERDAAKKFAGAEKDLHYPTLSAVGAAGVLPVHDPLLKDNYAAAGVNLSVPIFDGFLFSAREKEAQIKTKVADENLRDAENNVVRDVHVAAMNLTYAAERLALTAKLLASANEAFELARARLEVGSSSIVELSQAQLNQTTAQIAQAKAKYEYETRNAILRYQMGLLQ